MLIIGDLNARVEKHLEVENGISGRHDIPCDRNENGEKVCFILVAITILPSLQQCPPQRHTPVNMDIS
jgi:hypothetical protein